MCSLPFHIVDVFAETQYAGNQLAVVRDTGSLSETVMLKIAKEMNYSETTFILSTTQRDGGYDVRIFTPEKEIPFAGHPTLGTAFIIQQYILRRPTEGVRLNLKAGQIPVTFSYVDARPDTLWMQQFAPTFEQCIAAERIAPVLGLDVDELDERFPVEEVSTGLPTLIVPLKTLVSLKRLELATERYFSLIAHTWAKAILVFCP